MRNWVLAVGVSLGFGAAVAVRAAPVGQEEPVFRVGEPLRGLVLPVPEGVLGALKSRDWAAAGEGLRAMPLDGLKGAQKSDWAFLVGWAAIHGDHPESAIDVLPLLDGAVNVPEPYVALVRGEVLLAAGKPLDALAWLDKVDDDAVIAPR